MEDKKILSSEELEKVSGGGGDLYYHLQYLVCPNCGLQVGRDEFSPIGCNTDNSWTENSCTIYCRGCGYKVGGGYFAGEKDW